MLLTKLHIPTAGNNTVHRPELFEKLNSGLSRKLILISAPAGFGKTILLSDWINQNQIPTVWFSLDKGDNDPVEFLSYIIYGIQSIHPGFGQTALNLLNSPNNLNSQSIIGLLINEILSINQHFLLVLDDFHFIRSNDILELVTFLLQHIPANLHIAILTRSDPALPIARLRSQHQMVELRLSDLSFSANEISILFNKKLKIGLSNDDAYSLESKTEGWIAGLQLAALSLKAREDISGFIKDLKGDNQYIMDYLIEEVLRTQPEEIKEFLLQTSILKQISAPLCNAVLKINNSQVIIERLEKNNMFVIPLDSERNWFRYHHLFADLLKQRLKQNEKSDIIELNNNASDWFKNNSMPLLAIEHAIEAGNFEKSAQVLSEIIETMWENGQHFAIMKYGDLIPETFIKKNIEFCLYYSWVLIASGQAAKATPLLSCADALSNKVSVENNSTIDEIRYQKKLNGKIAVATAYLKTYTGNPDEIIKYCKIGLNNLSTDEPLWLGWAWFSMGVAHFYKGDLPENIRVYQKAFEYGKKSGNLHLLSTVALRMSDTEQQLGHYHSAYEKCVDFLSFMKNEGYSEIIKADWSYAGFFAIIGNTHYMWGNIDEAYEYVKKAYELSKKGKDIMLEILVLILYSIVLQERGENTNAEIKISEAEKLCFKNQFSPYLLDYLMTLKLTRIVEMKQFEKAAVLIKELGLSPTGEITHVNEPSYMGYSRYLLAVGEFRIAEQILSRLYEIVNAGKRIERLIVVEVTYAIYYKLIGEIDKATNCIMRAIELAAPENLIMFFVNGNELIYDLILEIIKKQSLWKSIAPATFIDNLKSALEKKIKQKNIHNSAGLSTRELDTLKNIAGNLTNQEIADKLFISLNTVKTHLKNIYLKLDVDSRTGAVVKAKEMGLL
jgi:LuxR family maltose regulon positive regulatory protein